MKIIFLDFDGVLNSKQYHSERDIQKCEFLDISRLNLIKKIVDATGAEIVLSTSWKHHWDQQYIHC